MKTSIFWCLLSLGLSAQTAFAETICNFTTECFETEACASTAFSVSFEVTTCPRDSGARGVVAETEFGALSGFEITTPCNGQPQVHADGDYALAGDGATYLLSIEDSVARLTTHITGPLSVTYYGTCEGPD